MYLKSFGFKYITVDVVKYRTGSLNGQLQEGVLWRKYMIKDSLNFSRNF